MSALRVAWALALGLAACSSSKPSSPKRVVLEVVGPASINLVPREGQLPYCLAFALTETGILEHLTTSNESVPCPAGSPVGGAPRRLSTAGGELKIHVVFSDRKLEAAPLAAQVRELGASAAFSAMDLRAPGSVALETLEHTPAF